MGTKPPLADEATKTLEEETTNVLQYMWIALSLSIGSDFWLLWLLHETYTTYQHTNESHQRSPAASCPLCMPREGKKNPTCSQRSMEDASPEAPHHHTTGICSAEREEKIKPLQEATPRCHQNPVLSMGFRLSEDWQYPWEWLPPPRTLTCHVLCSPLHHLPGSVA